MLTVQCAHSGLLDDHKLCSQTQFKMEWVDMQFKCASHYWTHSSFFFLFFLIENRILQKMSMFYFILCDLSVLAEEKSNDLNSRKQLQPRSCHSIVTSERNNKSHRFPVRFYCIHSMVRMRNFRPRICVIQNKISASESRLFQTIGISVENSWI